MPKTVSSLVNPKTPLNHGLVLAQTKMSDVILANRQHCPSNSECRYIQILKKLKDSGPGSKGRETFHGALSSREEETKCQVVGVGADICKGAREGNDVKNGCRFGRVKGKQTQRESLFT